MADVIAASIEKVRLDVVRPGPRVRASDPYPVEATATVQAPLVDRTPVALLPQRTYGASVQGRSVIDDYYETIHVRPALLDVGRLTSPVRREVEVWNAYREVDQTLERIDVTRGDGILISGEVSPVTLDRLHSTVFTVEVSPEGPATIDARYDLIFTGLSLVPYITVVGTRIIEWSVPPNWADGVEETVSYKTEVIQAYDGSEQRIALRARPRRRFAFTPLTSGEGDRTYKRLLSTWQNRAYAMADWPRGVRCVGGAAPGATGLTLDAPVAGLRDGGIIVVREGGESRVLEVALVDGVTLTLNSPLRDPVAPGARVYLGLNVHADPEISGRRLTGNVGRASMQFQELHIALREMPPAPETTWRGREVFLWKPNWRESGRIEHTWPVEWVDAGRGAFDFRVTVQHPKDVRRFTYLARNREEVEAIKDFFARCRGRRGEFYAPTWDDDMPIPDQVLPAGDSRLPVEDVADADRLSTETVYRTLLIRLSDGTRLYRQAYAGGDSPSGPGILLDDAWPRDIYPGEIIGIHFLPRCRLASDELTIQWVTDEVAEFTLALQVLPDVEGS